MNFSNLANMAKTTTSPPKSIVLLSLLLENTTLGGSNQAHIIQIFCASLEATCDQENSIFVLYEGVQMVYVTWVTF